MKKIFKRAVATMLAVLMFSASAVFAVQAKDVNIDITVDPWGDGGSYDGDAVETAIVSFSAYDGTVIIEPKTVYAKQGLAASYGYKVKTGSITVFDAVVAAHKAYYGAAFTKETAQDYLVMTDSYIKKAFGKSTSSLSFFVNNVMPNDGVYNPSYGSCTGYSCDTAVINSGDNISFFFYQDKSSYSDYYSFFDKSEYTATTDEELSMTVNGYSSWYGCNTWDTITSTYVAPMEGLDLYTYNNDGTSTKIGTTDKNGNASVTFSKAGVYTVYVAGSIEDEYEEMCPTIAAWCKVKVSSSVIAAEGISVSQPELTLKYKQSAALTATVSPENATDKSVVWTSSDESVATVDENGNVTATGKGTAVITASTADGQYSASCKVTVKYTLWQWIVSVLKWIVTLPYTIIHFLFGWIVK